MLNTPPVTAPPKYAAREVGQPTLLGRWIEEVRAGRGHGIEDVADICAISSNTLVALRRRRKRCWRRVLAAVGSYLDVEPEIALLLWETDIERAHTVNIGDACKDLSKLGRAIEEARWHRDHTLADVAAEIGRTPAVLSDIRTVNARESHAPTWEQLARYLGIDVATARVWSEDPAQHYYRYPVVTQEGTKYHPSIPAPIARYVGCGSLCDHCKFRAPCERDVFDRDGFAWCEDVIAADFDPGHQTESRRSLRA